MHRLRVFLRICFGYLTLISLKLSIFMVRTFYWMATHPHHYAYTYRGQRNLFLSGSLILLSRFVRLIPFLMAIVYGTAWWTLKHGRRSARAWSIAASILIVLSTAALFTASLLLWPARHHHFGFLLFQIFFFAVGVLCLGGGARGGAGARGAGARPRRGRGGGTSARL